MDRQQLSFSKAPISEHCQFLQAMFHAMLLRPSHTVSMAVALAWTHD